MDYRQRWWVPPTFPVSELRKKKNSERSKSEFRDDSRESRSLSRRGVSCRVDNAIFGRPRRHTNRFWKSCLAASTRTVSRAYCAIIVPSDSSGSLTTNRRVRTRNGNGFYVDDDPTVAHRIHNGIIIIVHTSALFFFRNFTNARFLSRPPPPPPPSFRIRPFRFRKPTCTGTRPLAVVGGRQPERWPRSRIVPTDQTTYFWVVSNQLDAESFDRPFRFSLNVRNLDTSLPA